MEGAGGSAIGRRQADSQRWAAETDPETSRRWSAGLRWGAWLMIGLVVLASSRTAQAQQTQGTPDAPAVPVVGEGQPPTSASPELKARLHSPRATFLSLFAAFQQQAQPGIGASCLDLSQLDADTAATKGDEYAYKLKSVIECLVLRVDLQRGLPNEDDWPDPVSLVRVLADGTSGSPAATDAARIRVSRGSDQLWRFDASTVDEIDSLYEKWKSAPSLQGESADQYVPFPNWLEAQFPAPFQQTIFLLPTYQWICIGVLIFIGFLADFLVIRLLLRISKIWFHFAKSSVEHRAEQSMWKPVGLMVQGWVWYGGTKLIGLPDQILSVLLAGLRVFTVIAAVWSLFRLIDLLGGLMMRRAERTETKFDEALVPLVTTSLKILAATAGIMFCATFYDLRLQGLLGGLGLGGAAVALASRDAISNFFGSLTVLLDRPFEIGDWVVTENVEGTVEEVGFRSTRVRTFYNSVVSLPNSRLTTAVVDNMGRREYRRVKCMLAIQYDTPPDVIESFCAGVRRIIQEHPDTRKDYYHVYLNEFSDSSLNILLYCFLRSPDWGRELTGRHQLFVDILRLAKELGVAFAFPTRTLHMADGEP